MLNLTDYAVSYGQSQIIQGLNLSIAPGEIVALVGRNGMGKTTLMKSLIGMIESRSGHVLFDGSDIISLTSHERVHRGLGFCAAGAYGLCHHDR